VPGVRDPWYLSRFTGLFRAAGAAARRAHDPAVAVWSGTPANRPVRGPVDAVGGAGWTEAAAELAAVGEAIERWQTHRLPGDATRRGRPDGAIDPAAWVLFSAAQHAQPGFPFVRLADVGDLDWVKFRRVADGEPAWVPAELAFMDLRPGAVHRFTPAISTGWSAYRARDGGVARAVVRGVQEVIERDALIGGWWGAYPIEALPVAVPAAAARANLTYHGYRIGSPYSDHVAMVTVEGVDREGPCFAIGSACRETRAASLDKALLEAVQGRHYVRYLRHAVAARGVTAIGAPRDFAEHAVAYSLEPARLAATPLARAQPAAAPAPTHPPARGGPGPAAVEASPPEALATIVRRLGGARPPLFRVMTPAAFSHGDDPWVVVRVMIPGLQPMHGDHALPFLGGPLWGDRPLAAWATIAPHPFA
jgi:ribosomal protein S12 methylthiotransferase accessory factor